MSRPTGKTNLKRKPHVLFLGPTNSARTQIAEAYGRDLLADLVEVRSAGMAPADMDPRTRQVLETDSVDTNGLYSKVLDQQILEWADLVVTLCADTHRLKFKEQDSFVHKNWPMEDPARIAKGPQDLAPYLQARDDIKRRIRQFSNSIRLMNR
jgi:arsenate reductase (thioredoxin)